MSLVDKKQLLQHSFSCVSWTLFVNFVAESRFV